MLKSPFPGMDPFLESRWPEVHASLIVYARNQINPQLPSDLQANIEENLAVYEGDVATSIRPDIHLSQDSSFTPSSAGHSIATVAAPLVLKRPPHPTRHIEIVDPDGRVITAIEFISPWNKVGSRAREQYTRKQLDYINAGVNLVEIDLVRQGSYVLAAPLEELRPEQHTPYMICVYRDQKPDQFEVYRAPLDKPLPNIPIPLRYDERDVILQLQPLVDQCYHDGRYYRMDYTAEPRGKFSKELTHWLDERLHSEGRRGK